MAGAKFRGRYGLDPAAHTPKSGINSSTANVTKLGELAASCIFRIRIPSSSHCSWNSCKTITAMSIDAPAYIVSLQNNIRARPISWEGAVRAKTITDEDLKKIKAIDKVRKEQRKQTIEGDVKTYTALLLGNGETKSIFESAAKRTDILQYMLVLTGDLVDGKT